MGEGAAGADKQWSSALTARHDVAYYVLFCSNVT